MSKAKDIIDKQTVMRAVQGNIQTMKIAAANIRYLIWMHQELEEEIDIDRLFSEIDTLIGQYFDALPLERERVVEDAIIEEYGWH